METFAAKPTASIPDACDNRREAHSVYRFLANSEVNWEAILTPQWARTVERMSAYRLALCIQDTTELDFNGHESLALGRLITKQGAACMYTDVRGISGARTVEFA